MHAGPLCCCPCTWSRQQHKVPGKNLEVLSAVKSDHRAVVEGGGALLSPTQPQQAVVLAPSRSFPPLSLTPALVQHLYGCWQKSQTSVPEFWHAAGSTLWSAAGLAPSAEMGIAWGCHLLPRSLCLSQLLGKDLGTALFPHLSGAGTKQFSFKTNFISLQLPGVLSIFYK